MQQWTSRAVQFSIFIVTTTCSAMCLYAQTDPLPSWNDHASKKAIVAFVEKVTREGTSDFVPVDQRIATFDNDGTLWIEQSMYVQLAFIFDRVRDLEPKHPEWKSTQPFKGLLYGDMKGVVAAGENGLIELMAATHAGMTPAQFDKIVTDWLAKAQQPKFKRPYTQCVYQPMLELLAYLRANGFKTYIVSGGGIEIYAPLDRKGLWHSSRASGRKLNQDKVRDCRRQT